MSKKGLVIFIVVWLAALAGAFVLDQPVKEWLYVRHFHEASAGLMKGTWWAKSIKWMGDVRLVIALGVVLVVAGQMHWKRAVTLVLCASTAILSDVAKWVSGRQRPIARDGTLTPLFDFVPFSARPAGYAFFSGHTMLAFATATCIARYYPRWSGLAFFLASLVAAERVLEIAHHVSDVVAGAGAGILMSLLCMRLLAPWEQRPNRESATEKVTK